MSQNAPTSLLIGTIDTSGVAGQTGSLAFTASTFGYDNSVSILIQNVKVDGTTVGLAVPEPSSLLLFGSGLGLLALLRKFRRVST